MKINYEEFRKILDQVFKRDDVRGRWGGPLDGHVAYYIGRAFYTILNKDGAHIVMGRDMRTGSPEMAAQLAKGFQDEGGQVTDLGMCGSEMIYFAAGEDKYGFDGGAMATASHNPPHDAGVKFVKKNSKPLSKDDLAKLKEEVGRVYLLCLQKDLKAAPLNKGNLAQLRKKQMTVRANLSRPQKDIRRDFVEKQVKITKIEETVQKNSEVKRVLIEAGNGMGGYVFKFVDKGLSGKKVPVQCVYSNHTPNGNFPICTPNPLLDDYQRVLKYNIFKYDKPEDKVDLGICFDGDADRAGFADDRGEVLDASIVSIVLCKMLAPMHPKRNVVMGNLNTSLRFLDYVKANKHLKCIWTPVGHAKIKELMSNPPKSLKFESKNVLFASEHSGHYFYPDFFYADSGMITSLFMIKALINDELDPILKNCREGYFHSGEINKTLDTDEQAVNVIKDVAKTYNKKGCSWRGIVAAENGADIVQAFKKKEKYEEQNLTALDLRVDADSGDWWFSLRKSGNEPKLRLNVETRDENSMVELRDKLLGMMSKG